MPTALELTREEWQPYIEAAKQRPTPAKLSMIEQQQREQLLSRVREAAKQLKVRYGVQRVILFGSLANVDWFTPNSDVDLAVEGLSTGNFWQAWQMVEEVIGDCLVDLIEVETAKESLLRAIQRYGIEL
ncbi:hypothetical protein MNBD_CHLOROFLEXI01-4503 [hydrothermal vent metagenome]|uniref:Polymerase beta nucleotidyltransferase domain-containing protein n=1 Tax=hydrothermal vent metagenome TaxID=652676 RepID=A0A3B0UKK2_9ZZZZ